MSIADVRGVIIEGHLRFSLASYFVAGPVISTPLHDVVLDVAIDEHGVSGVMGGGVDIEELVAFSSSIMPVIDPTLVEGQYAHLRGFSDLSPRAADPSICDRISMAFELEAVRITLPVRR